MEQINYITGNEEKLRQAAGKACDRAFSDERINYLDALSKNIKNDKRSRLYPDVLTFAFFIRKANMELNAKRFRASENIYMRGRGIVFHIAPSNVAVNFAYSLVTGFITGNTNIVRLPSRDFEQVNIIADAVNKTNGEFPALSDKIFLVKYGHEKEINDYFSSICDVRVIWGGDDTINTIRESKISPRTTEITFADRYSYAVIDAEYYLSMSDKRRVATDFYNDTYLTDQNACSSPRAVIWLGSEKKVPIAREEFWRNLHDFVKEKYSFQDIQGIDKLTEFCLAANAMEGFTKIETEDNLIIRIMASKLDKRMMDYRGNSGYFYEYMTKNIMDITALSDERVQTIAYLGEKEIFEPVLSTNEKLADRIVPVGHTMDFDFIWDGYNLIDEMTRLVAIH